MISLSSLTPIAQQHSLKANKYPVSAFFMSIEGDMISFTIDDDRFRIYTKLLASNGAQSDNVSRCYHTFWRLFGEININRSELNLMRRQTLDNVTA